jgi:transposase-like protein
MNCTDCSAQTKKHGTDRKGNQGFRCVACGKTFVEPQTKLLGNMYLSEDKALMCLNLLVEAMSVRSPSNASQAYTVTPFSRFSKPLARSVCGLKRTLSVT